MDRWVGGWGGSLPVVLGGGVKEGNATDGGDPHPIILGALFVAVCGHARARHFCAGLEEDASFGGAFGVG